MHVAIEFKIASRFPIPHNSRFLVARVPRFNLRYLGQLPIAQNPRLLVAGVTLERRTRRGEIDPADSEFQGLVYRNGQNRDFGGPAECA